MIKWRIKEFFKHIIGFILWCTPSVVYNIIYKYAQKRKITRQRDVFRCKVSENDVKDAFDILNISGDVFVHASLVNVGNVKGMHKPFVEQLNKVVECGGTLLFPAIPIKGSSYNYLKNLSRFDKFASNAMGVLSRYYGSLQISKRSLEPTHSVIAVGDKSELYTNSHHFDTTPFGKNSPYYKLLENDGNIIMIGASLSSLTICHIVEDLLGDFYPHNVYAKQSFIVDIVKDNHITYRGVYHAHNPFWSAMRTPEYILHKISMLPTTKIVKLGVSNIFYLNAIDVVICVLYELLSGNSIYGYVFVSRKCKEKIQEQIQQLNGFKK